MFVNDIIYLYKKGYSIEYITLQIYRIYPVFTKNKIKLQQARTMVESTILEYLKL